VQTKKSSTFAPNLNKKFMIKNNLNKFKPLVFMLAFVLVSGTLKAATYTTLVNGDWNNTSNVWSLDGVTACGCEPGSSTNGNTIVVNHAIAMTSNLDVSGGSILTVSGTGGLSGGNNVTVTNGTANFYADVTFSKFIVKSGAIVNVSGAVMSLNSRLIVEGLLNVDGGYVLINSGNITIEETGSILTSNSGKIDALGGNIENYGVVDICMSCCMTTKGNWKNFGNVIGNGSATSTSGNMSNAGNWSLDILWCSDGNDFGMPTSEKCTEAGATCNAVVLPVELSKFEVELLIDARVLISWQTVSEINSDYFIVLKSLNGTDWTEVETVYAAGNSTETIDYSAFDLRSSFDIAYYRLLQVDFDGTKTYSKIKALSGKQLTEITVFPNPASLGNTSSVAITNVENAQISIVDVNGRPVYSTVSYSNTAIIDLTEIRSGIYFARIITIKGEVISEQIVILD
jgi:hypothetical protein